MNTEHLDVIASEPPAIPADAVRGLLRREYGIDAERLRPLVSERDQNLRVTSAAGEFVFKIANAAEDPAVTDFQIRALRHVEAGGLEVPAVPRLRLTLDGTDRVHVTDGSQRHVARLVSWVPGVPLDAARLDAPLSRELGSGLGRLARALADFDHPGTGQGLLWDLQRAPALRHVLPSLGDPDERALVAACLDEFESDAAPVLAGLPTQVIHNDGHAGNLLLDGGSPPRLAGVIDFGDMQRAPLVVDVAVAAAYLRSQDDELAFIAPFLAGYHAEAPLSAEALGILPVLICMRLATTIAVLGWRQSLRRDGDAYLAEAVASAPAGPTCRERLRLRLRAELAERLAAACDGLQPES